MARAKYPGTLQFIYTLATFVYHGRFMYRIIFRYIFKETAVPFFLGMAIFTFVLLMGRLLKLAELVFAKGVPVFDVCKLIFFMLPSFLVITIPMAFLLAVLLAFGRLSADSEVIALKAGGVGTAAMMPPVLTFAALAYLATTFVSVYALPWGNTSFKEFLYEVIETRAAMSINEKVFNDDFPGLVIYVDNYDPRTHEITGILIHDERNPEEPSTIFASSGKLVTIPEERTVRLHLENGSIHRSQGGSIYRLIEFASYDLLVTLQQQKKDYRNELDMSLSELMSHLHNPREDAKFHRDVLIELNKRFALPFACFVFAVIGVPLGIQNQRSGKAGGFSAALLLLMLYYILMSAGRTLGEKGIVHPAVGAWLPNGLFIALGLYLLHKAATEQPVPLAQAVSDLIHWAKTHLGRRRRDS